MPHTCDKGAALPRLLLSITEDNEFFKEPEEEVESALLRDASGSTLPGTNCWGPDPSHDDGGVVMKSVM